MIDDVEVLGAGMHEFGRFPDRSLKDLGGVAVRRALDDAGVGLGDIDAVYSANSLAGLITGQEQIRGQTVVRDVGLEGVPVVNVENACASGSTAFREAVMAVAAGFARVVLVVGHEKMYHADRTRALEALRSASDLEVTAGLGLQFTAVYAMRLRARLDDGSLTLDDLAAATVKSHAAGARNPYAQHRKEVTADEVLASRMIADPLTLPMCSSISDGAAAVIVARRGAVPGLQGRTSVRVRASALRTSKQTDGRSVASRTAADAYDQSGVGPEDVDVLEVHDAMAPGELLYYEHLGLCPEGEGARLLRDGVTGPGGAHEVNPSGGLSSRGHPVGATGVAQIAELTWQLRGQAEQRQVDGARIALAQNSGGWADGDSAVCAIHVLEGAR
ncbi:thiolase family protein [Pseudonocardia acaciae]|uniref:thiolase family protein n=1 Tax=Pseudonocardia acaciae TaxID=551276 RepID=UPI00049086AF|nr:thiolase family protein [Pseudonocardia acaciae]